MHVIPNGIDTERFKPQPRTPNEVLTFGLVGRMNPMKDHATFLAAAALDPHAKFIIVGSGDAAYEQQMRDLSARLGIADRVTWLPAQNDMPAVYAKFDCLVNSSAFGEGFSNVIGEAMACGVPCIASNVGDSAWIIGDNALDFPRGRSRGSRNEVHARLQAAQPANRQRSASWMSSASRSSSNAPAACFPRRCSGSPPASAAAARR